MKRIVCLAGAVIFLILGLIGLVLPVIPQVPFLALSLLLFARGSRTVHHRLVSSRLFNERLRPIIKKSSILSKLLDIQEFESTEPYTENKITGSPGSQETDAERSAQLNAERSSLPDAE